MASLATADFECSICLELLFDPVTIPCGHTLCRVCLMRSLNEKLQCPLCRHDCQVNALNHPGTTLIATLLYKLFPTEMAIREQDAIVRKRCYKRRLPVYFTSHCSFPNANVQFYVFESRYQSMVTQAMSSTKEFVSVFAIDESTEQNQPPCCARIGSVISIREIRTEVEGRWFVDGRVTEVVRVSDMEPVPDAFGLVSAEISSMHEDSGPGGIADMAAHCKHVISDFQRENPNWEDMVESSQPPDNPRALAFWAAALVAGPPRFQLQLIEQMSTRKRLEIVTAFLDDVTRRRREANRVRRSDLCLAAGGALLALMLAVVPAMVF